MTSFAEPTAAPITVDRAAEGVALVELHRPPHNYFDLPLVRALADIHAELDADDSVRAIVLCSEGRNFCAGANFGGDGSRSEAVTTEVANALYAEAVRLFSVATPVVAAVQGIAIGGGLGLAVSADFRVAGPGSRFAANFARLGLHQGFGLSVSLPRVVGAQHTLDMLLTGRRVGGEEALRFGLVDRLVGDEEIRAGAVALAAEVAAAAPLAVRSIRATMRAGLAEEVAAITEHEAAEQRRLRETADFREGVAASLERRDPRFIGR
ncbi:enoyl-CoA hydratase/isomerase family protein [Pseudonocardia asaccharolytica]|uniref:Enoyl-CoA hydratase n=1 Tax=Pseudonocardia asaccharolytica DSM 44247 = NBRC 16224 TaxID=1123024 RepID=A0A511CX32_9PSEU|nr:enoyl-CoA hydratase/isomerase family protein [Pseudonocardia asaccharolytica]GEL17121.1 enoyl-CoA hydratase [Pseudonocardia asaccharolytica DSM 44247 = NBRC 16224]